MADNLLSQNEVACEFLHQVTGLYKHVKPLEHEPYPVLTKAAP